MATERKAPAGMMARGAAGSQDVDPCFKGLAAGAELPMPRSSAPTDGRSGAHGGRDGPRRPGQSRNFSVQLLNAPSRVTRFIMSAEATPCRSDGFTPSRNAFSVSCTALTAAENGW